LSLRKEGILLLVLGLCRNRKKESDAKQAHGEDTNFKSAAGSKTKPDGPFRGAKKIGTKISGLSDSNSTKMTPGLTEKIQAQQGTHESEPVGRSDP
jgi:hypothetical protein